MELGLYDSELGAHSSRVDVLDRELAELQPELLKYATSIHDSRQRVRELSWLSVESRRVALATIATPSRADAPRRRPVAAVRHAIAAKAPATHLGGQTEGQGSTGKCNAPHVGERPCLVRRFDVEFVVEISRRAPLGIPTSLSSDSHRPGCR